MELPQAVALIKKGVSRDQSVWADMGAGSGLFTLALSEILGSSGVIFAVDRQLGILRQHLKTHYQLTRVHLYETDFAEDLELPALDGILMANALHYTPDPERLLNKMLHYLKEGGSFLLIEYETDRSNKWVPHPVSFERFKLICQNLPLSDPEWLDEVPSFYGTHRNIYSALSTKISTNTLR